MEYNSHPTGIPHAPAHSRRARPETYSTLPRTPCVSPPGSAGHIYALSRIVYIEVLFYSFTDSRFLSNQRSAGWVRLLWSAAPGGHRNKGTTSSLRSTLSCTLAVISPPWSSTLISRCDLPALISVLMFSIDLCARFFQGKGKMRTYWLLGEKTDVYVIWVLRMEHLDLNRLMWNIQ